MNVSSQVAEARETAASVATIVEARALTRRIGAIVATWFYPRLTQ